NKISTFSIQTISQHDFKMEPHLFERMNELNRHLRFGVILIALLQSRSRFKDLQEYRERDLIHDPIGIHGDNPIVNLTQIAHVLPRHVIRGLSFVLIAGFIETEDYGSVVYNLLHHLEPFRAEGSHLPW